MTFMKPVLALVGLAMTVTPAAAQTQATPEAEATAAEEETAATAAADYEITGDPAQGERVFTRCRACHSVEPDQNLVGPTLNNVLGREAGAVEGFNYSPVMAEADLVWSPENLHAYLEAPNEFLPGNRMIFPGLPSEEDRANVIAFLAQHSQVAEEPGAAEDSPASD